MDQESEETERMDGPIAQRVPGESDSESTHRPSNTGSAPNNPSTPPRKKGPSGALITVLILFAVAIIGLIAFGALPRLAQQKSLNEHTVTELHESPAVSVCIAQPGSKIQVFTLPGATEAIQDAPIYARVDGYLHKRYVNIGDQVKRGQVLADIDTPELDQQVQAADSSVEQAKAAVDNSKQALDKANSDVRTAHANVQKAVTDLQFFTRELGRYRVLAQQGAVSLEDSDSKLQAYNGGTANLDAMKAAENSAIASVASAKAGVNVAQAALNAAKHSADQVEATRSFRKVTALFDGTVTKRNVDAGALITAGSGSSNAVLFEIADTTVLRVFVYVPEQFVPYIKQGQTAKLEFQEYPEKDFIGIVTNVSGGVDATSRTLQVEIHIDNKSHVLLPGMYAKVKFEAPTKVPMPVVPATTLQTRPDGGFIFTVDKQNKAHLHKVDIGRDLGGFIEVESGAVVGDHVIINPSDLLRDNQTVDPVMTDIGFDKDKKAKS